MCAWKAFWLLVEGRLAACQMTALEYLNNAPDPRGYETLWGALHAHRWQRFALAQRLG